MAGRTSSRKKRSEEEQNKYKPKPQLMLLNENVMQLHLDCQCVYRNGLCVIYFKFAVSIESLSPRSLILTSKILVYPQIDSHELIFTFKIELILCQGMKIEKVCCTLQSVGICRTKCSPFTSLMHSNMHSSTAFSSAVQWEQQVTMLQ